MASLQTARITKEEGVEVEVVATANCKTIGEKKVYCLLCYNEVVKYDENVPKVMRKVRIQTTTSLLQYIGGHLDMGSEEVTGMLRKVGKGCKKDGRGKFLSGNLPLCGKCRENYYGKLYDAFVDYQMAMDRLHDKIMACVTKKIATSAKKWPDSVGETGPEKKLNEEAEVADEHEVMKMVKLFRKKVVDKNPSGYAEEDKNENGFGDEEPPPAAPRTKLVPPSQAIKNVIHVVKTSFAAELLRTAPEDNQNKETSSNTPATIKPNLKQLDYYAVANPQPGIIQIIPMAAHPGPPPYRNRNRKERHLSEQRARQKTCKFCQKPFDSKILLTRHMVAEHGMEKPFKCTQCDYKTFYETYLSSHMQTHIDISERQKPYQCDECGKEFFGKGSFKNHMNEHKGIKQTYICEICGKQFNCSASRQFCVDKHNGVKNHECPFAGCGKKFLRREVLKIHERTHTGERPFICKVCGKGFSQRSPLVTHLKNVHVKTENVT